MITRAGFLRALGFAVVAPKPTLDQLSRERTARLNRSTVPPTVASEVAPANIASMRALSSSVMVWPIESRSWSTAWQPGTPIRCTGSPRPVAVDVTDLTNESA